MSVINKIKNNDTKDYDYLKKIFNHNVYIDVASSIKK